ncbi:MAG: hypothetical protein KI792_02885 [Alphaproteobacteria bacterium]|nr:hypothetical protein [Alphaproteobacteria bacterium SS10]
MDTFAIEVEGSSSLVRFEAPPAPNSTRLEPVSDQRTINLIGRLKDGDNVIIGWESRQGRRVPIWVDKLMPAAIADAAAKPIMADAGLIPRQRLTDRGGRFDISTPVDPRLPGTETIVYDRVFNGITGHRDIYRMYIDGRLPLCLTCFIEPRIRAVMGNPTVDPTNTTVVVQRLNENAAADGRLSERLDWGVNHDLWALNIETREFKPVWISPPGHGAVSPQFLNALQIRFAERALPAADDQAVAQVGAFARGRQRQDPWFNWKISRTNIKSTQPRTGGSQDLEGQPRLVTSGITSLVTRIANGDKFQRLYDSTSTFRLRVIDHGLIERPRRSEFSPPDRVGPALRDRGRKVMVYSSSRSIPARQLGAEEWQTPTDLFIRVADGPLYQLTNHGELSRRTGDAYQIIDLDWTNDRRVLIAAIQARNPITRREREAEIWRFDLDELLKPATAAGQPAN